MGLFDIFKRSQPSVSLEEYLDGYAAKGDFIVAAKFILEPFYSSYEKSCSICMSTSGKYSLGYLSHNSDFNPAKVFKNENVNAISLLEKACETGFSEPAILLAVLFDFGVQESATRSLEADSYYGLAISRGGSGGRIAQAIQEMKKKKTSWNEMTTDDYEALAVSLLTASSFNKNAELYQQIQDIVLPEDKELFSWIASFLVCWYASRKQSLSLTILACVLLNYKMDSCWIRNGMFYDFFAYWADIQERGAQIINFHLAPRHNNGDTLTTQCLKYFGAIR